MTLAAYDDVLIPVAHVPRRYNKTPRTIEYWLRDKALDFPQPIFVRGRRFFSLRALEAWESQFADRFGAKTEAA